LFKKNEEEEERNIDLSISKMRIVDRC